MAVRKLAISLPEEVLAQIDAAAAERGQTRSGFISASLVTLARARTDREISRLANQVFADPGMRREQGRTARALARVRGKGGTKRGVALVLWHEP